MGSIHTLVSKICDPNPVLFPDQSLKQAQLRRNLTTFYAFLTAIAIFFISFLVSFSKLSLFNVMITLSVFIIFIVMCRSYIKTFHLLHTLFISFAGFAILDLVDDFALIYLGYAFALPPFLMMIQGDIKFAGFAGLMQIVVMHVKLKPSLTRLIALTSVEEFSERFVNIMGVHFVTILIVELYFLRLLFKRTGKIAKAKKRTEEVLEQQRTFIFSFSHELRNPLNSLLGNLQLILLGGSSPSAVTEMVNTAKTCGEILLQSINNVLDTGKHDMGKLEVNPVPTRVSELFQRSWMIYQEVFRQKKLKSSLRIDKNVFSMLKIDAMKINQVISNLIGNSMKFTEKGSINIVVEWIERETVDDECFEPEPYDETDEGIFDKDENISLVNKNYGDPFGSYIKFGEDKTLSNLADLESPSAEVNGVLKIIIQDTGCGMKEDSLNKLFQKFSQVSDDIGRRQIGTGLGLFITKQICKAMKGDVRAYSKPSVGTTFVVCIPTNAIPVCVSSPTMKGSSAMTSLLKGRRVRALVADDSPFNVKLTCNYLSQLGGVIACVAYNGEEAYLKYREEQAKETKIDLIVLDIDMPKMNGKTVCEKIRKYEQEKNLKPTKIVFISGNYEKEKIHGYLDQNKGGQANLFLKKPVSFDDFHAAIYKLIIKE